MTDRRSSGFHSGMRLQRARGKLREIVSPHGRTVRRSLPAAGGRVLASSIDARANVPHYARAALDGYAIRASDTRGASEDDPIALEWSTESVSTGEAARVHTGSPIPEGADAVVRIERAAERDDVIEVSREIPEGKNVAPVGEDVREGQHLYDPGHRLRPSDVGLLKSAGVREVAVYERPRVSVLPTGEELVESDPGPGEVIETNGLTVTKFVESWGGDPRYRCIASDEVDALREAIGGEREADLVVTIGGSSVGERDRVPEAVDSIGELLAHGVSLKPGHPFGFGLVEGTPILLLPGYPVSCIVNAVQFLRPAVHWSVGARPKPFPTTEATLAEPIESSPGIRRFARVRLRPADPEGDEMSRSDEPSSAGQVAVPTTHSGAGVLSSVALADGWVVVPEEAGDLPAGSTVAVQDWEWHP